MASLLPVVIFLGLVFIVVFLAAARRPEWVAGALLVLLLLQELAIRWLTHFAHLSSPQVSGISLWKDLALLGLLLGTGLKVRRSRRSLRAVYAWRSCDSALAVFAGLGVLGVLLTPNKLAGLAAVRDYFEPVALLVVARLATRRGGWTRTLLIVWLVSGALMAGLAIWQGAFWTAQDYVRWGYGTPSGQVGIPDVGLAGQSRLRPPSTVTGPNELAIHLVLLAAAAAFLLFESNGRARLFLVPALVLYGSALAFTASRSGFLGLVVALLVVAVAFAATGKGWITRDLGRSARLAVFGGAILAVGAIAAVVVLTGLGGLLLHTVQSLGGQYHTADTLGAIDYLFRHPGGVGMGLVGPRQGFGFPEQAAFHVEGSYFQMAMDFGVWGLAVFVVFLILAVREVWRNRRQSDNVFERVVSGTAIAGWAGASVAFFFLPLMQALPLMAWLWFLLGLGLRLPETGPEDGPGTDDPGQAEGLRGDRA